MRFIFSLKRIILPLFIMATTIITLPSCRKTIDETSSPKTAKELTEAIRQMQYNNETPGFAISIIKDDQLIYQEAFGQADIANNQAYTNTTTQPIGSISKTFIAAAIIHAIEAGYFTLETSINEILPFEVHNPNQPDSVIRVKHLVTHTSGLIDNAEAYFAAYHIPPGEDLSTSGAQLIQYAFGVEQRAGIPLGEFLMNYYTEEGSSYSLDNFSTNAPGVSWLYSNIASSLAAYLVEVATSTPFKEYVST
ncbi:MAG TPA: class A beta-lactamase-related serine hydrolase, partial [Saprospiraceae bacterium]|nr:class A beta-lactamase-related serine hydrolase [Saprospiraceae bacterium]